MRRGTVIKYALVALMSVILNAYAVAPGFYLGFMFGPATNNASPQKLNLTSPGVIHSNVACIGPQIPTAANLNPFLPCCKKQCLTTCQSCFSVPPSRTAVIAAEPRAQQWGGRIFMGNQINNLISFEGGLSLFSNIDYKAKITTPILHPPSGEARVRSFDILLKAAFPFRDIADVYVKGGGALVYLTTSGALNSNGRSTYKSNLRPVLAIGATYDFNQNWVGDLSYTYLQVGSIVKNVSFFAIGFSYHFVNLYCGQFLC